MKTVVALPIAVAIAIAGGCAAEERCTGTDTRYFNQALSRQLTKDGVPHVVKSPDLVCFPATEAARVEAIYRRVNDYFRDVATLLKDSCEERAFVEWAEAQRLIYDVSDVKNADGSSGGRMFFLRSMSPEEVLVNRNRLMNEAPRGQRCKA